MASFTSRAFRTILEPVLKKHGIDLPPAAQNLFGRKAARNAKHKESPMGSLFRFLLINAVSVIGAKLLNDAAERVSQKLFKDGEAQNTADPAHPDAPTLETRICPKCGAFRIRGEQCACGAR